MRKEIADSKDNYLEKMFKYIRRYFKLPKDQWNKEDFLIGLEDTIYKSLEETYSITASAAKEIYNITFTDKIDNDTLRSLTYSADGKTLNDRLNNHYDNAIERDDPTTYFYNRIVLIMDTETLYSFRFSWICLNPSQNTFVAPPDKNTKSPVEPKVWWNGKNAMFTSVG